jgi:hypothetical protein
MLQLENVELVHERRRTVRIHTGEGQYVGFSSWALQDRGGETLVSYEVYCFHPFPKETVRGDMGALAQQANDDGLRRLKAFVETGRPT